MPVVDSEFKKAVLGAAVASASLSFPPAALLLINPYSGSGDEADVPANAPDGFFDLSFWPWSLAILVGGTLAGVLLFAVVPRLIHQGLAWLSKRLNGP